MIIPLFNSTMSVEIDDSDYPRVGIFIWRAIRKWPSKTWYAATMIKGKRVTIHRYILELSDPKIKVDHRDRNGLNNKRENLRIATQSQNMANTGLLKSNTSGYKGVYWHTCSKPWKCGWRMQIICKNKRYTKGPFKIKEDAARAYDKKALELFGEFAALNFPNEALVKAEGLQSVCPDGNPPPPVRECGHGCPAQESRFLKDCLN